mgnify:CR=1 FL=1
MKRRTFDTILSITGFALAAVLLAAGALLNWGANFASSSVRDQLVAQKITFGAAESFNNDCLKPLASWVLEAIDDLEVDCSLDLLRRIPKALRAGNFKGTAVIVDKELIDVQPGDTTATRYGVAYDLGTTTVVATLLDLNTGTPVAVRSMLNKQQPFGADVISRISATMMDPTALDRLRDTGMHVPDAAVRRGLADVKWPARVEVVRTSPVVILDTAHNVPSAEALVGTLRDSFPHAGAKRVVFAVSESGKLEGILTDGDFRRRMSTDDDLLTRPLRTVMTRNPICIRDSALAVEALKVFNERNIDDLVVINARREPPKLRAAAAETQRRA